MRPAEFASGTNWIAAEPSAMLSSARAVHGSVTPEHYYKIGDRHPPHRPCQHPKKVEYARPRQHSKSNDDASPLCGTNGREPIADERYAARTAITLLARGRAMLSV